MSTSRTSVIAFAALACLIPSWAWGQSVRAMVMTTVTNLDYGGHNSVLALGYESTQMPATPVTLPPSSAYFSGTTNSGAQGTMVFSGTATASVGEAVHGPYPLPKGLHAHVQGTVSNIFYNPVNPPYFNALVSPPEVDEDGVPDELEVYGLAEINEIHTLNGPGTGQARVSYRFYVTGQITGGPLDAYGNGTIAWMKYQAGSNPPEYAWFTMPNLPNGRFAGYFNTGSYPAGNGVPQTTTMSLVTEYRTTTTYLAEGSQTHGNVDFGSTIRLIGIDVTDEEGNALAGWTLTDSEGVTYEFPEIFDSGFEPDLATTQRALPLAWDENCSAFRVLEETKAVTARVASACDLAPGTIRAISLQSRH